ncbi:MAG: glutathione S-transferase family protein [Rhodanobacteraceae bacterium]
MNNDTSLVFFHNPHSRSCMTRALLEELGADYEVCPIDFKRDEQRSDQYLAVNPMGKVPAVRRGDAIVTETIALYIWLADLFPQAGLAPTTDDSQRGPYLRWLVFYAACFEPAIADKALKRESGPHMLLPYGNFDDVIRAIMAPITRGPYLLGERFTAADVMWGNALRWVTGFGTLEATPVIQQYIDRVMARPAQQRAQKADAALAKEMGLDG